MEIQMFNGWYFFWVLLLTFITIDLYLLFKNKSKKAQDILLFSLLAVGLILHFTKCYYPPYSTDEARMLRDSWFVNICGANIALFPFLYFSKNKHIRDYMFYIGVISGLIAIFYPQEPIDKVDQINEYLDIIRFYYHHWMLLAVPLLRQLWGHHKLSYKRVLNAPTGLMLLALFIILNQIFQSELGFIPLRNGNMIPNYKNTSYIWGPLNQDGSMDPIGGFLAIFTPEFFKAMPIGPHKGEIKYWPWFWLLCPIYLIVTTLAFLISLIQDHKNFASDMRLLKSKCVCVFKKAKEKSFQNKRTAK